MEDRFEIFTTEIANIYKDIQRIKKQEMIKLGLKGPHVVCLNFLRQSEEGLTAGEICNLSKEDKAGISRSLAELEAMGLITYEAAEKRKYRAKAVLTEKGRKCSAKMAEFINQAVHAGGADFDEEERKALYYMLKSVSRNLDAYCEELEKAENENK